eukprot:TRINITY_DN15950_c0_g1::TRINITY_DN15950_c0_g1_i1::g.3825::m.3825 TRINITY_DN15950_c0_g1::TRINITY_DN15950_c0_g1_i1::g.3825  ORF type:complete len:103 (+),score=6.29,MoaC/PF01967.16/0.0061 TRINITY_DN15950_c0_g1_i1:123-431(+)
MSSVMFRPVIASKSGVSLSAKMTMPMVTGVDMALLLAFSSTECTVHDRVKSTSQSKEADMLREASRASEPKPDPRAVTVNTFANCKDSEMPAMLKVTDWVGR